MITDFEELPERCSQEAKLRERLLNEGSLFNGYNPEMEMLQTTNGLFLESLIRKMGWPFEHQNTIQEAAWLIVMHAISLPSLQRLTLNIFKAYPGEYPTPRSAMLEDRVLVFSGKKQRFGTQSDWDENGELSPYPIQEEESVEERRIQAGLPPLSIALEELRNRAIREEHHAPEDLPSYTRQREEWMLRVGWITDRSQIDPAYGKYR